MFKRWIAFLREVKVELMDKTTWPSKDDVLNSTIVTVVSICIVSVCLYLVDMGSSVVIQFVVVEKINILKSYLNPFSYLVFVVAFTFLVIAYHRVRSRFNR